MANQTHSTITDPDIHEPKGISSASGGRVYRADGAGSGAWVRPIELLASGDDVSGTSFDVTGLSDYRQIIFVLEASNVSNDEFVLQLYSTSGAVWRTSGYLSSFHHSSDNADISAAPTNGLGIAKTFSSGRSYSTAIARISNFNSATQKTQCIAESAAMNTFYPTSATTSSSDKGVTYQSLYNTAEAHEGIRLSTQGGSTFSNVYYSVWGIR